VALIALAVLVLAGCRGRERRAHSSTEVRPPRTHAGTVNIYAHTGPGDLQPVAEKALPRAYVPNSLSESVSVIDLKTYQVIRTFHTGKTPQHVVPSYDLSTLWVANNGSDTLTPIDPLTGKDGAPVRVSDPYNLYFTPDGRDAMVIAEARHRIDFREAKTMKLVKATHIECGGLDHVEFTADDRYAIATCEFSGQLVKIDLNTRAPVGYLELDPGEFIHPVAHIFTGIFAKMGNHRSMPQDIRSSPDGRRFYVADMMNDGVFVIDPAAFKAVGFIHTGVGTHGIYPSRDGTKLYITNRGWNTTAGGPHGPGSVSVLDPVSDTVVATWPVPGGGSPDMGNVTADGTELWVSGRYDREVYVFNTGTGSLKHRIPVGREPHGLCVWPQPGRYSLGHTGNMR
jgi:YVTN family beta-propeller protein